MDGNSISLMGIPGIFSIIHPTARPNRWQRAWQEWRNAADNPDKLEYVLICEHSLFRHLPPEDRGLRVICHEGGVTACLNRGAALSIGDVMMHGADDVFPMPHWDTLFRQYIPDAAKEAVLWVRTGCPNDCKIILQPILTRAYYLCYGYFWNPVYYCYGDPEFTVQALQDGVVIDARDRLAIRHEHYTVGHPENYDWLNARMNSCGDDEVERERKASGMIGKNKISWRS
jgi:hypothetical protein